MSTFGVFIFKQKKSGRKCPAPSLDFCYVPSLPLTQKKNRVPTIGGGLLYIYKFYSFLRRYNFFFFSKKVYTKVGRARWNLGIWFLLLFFFFWSPSLYGWVPCVHVDGAASRGGSSGYVENWKETEEWGVRLFKCIRAERRTTCATGSVSSRPKLSFKRREETKIFWEDCVLGPPPLPLPTLDFRVELFSGPNLHPLWDCRPFTFVTW
jgi:hypothetical protein